MVSALAARGQGTTFIYDQQSATNQSISPGFTLQAQPEGQSFTPALASVGFVQFEFWDGYPGGGVGATVYVNLLAGSISGTVLDSTAPVFMPYGFSYGITNFFFATPVAVTPGTTYYLQPVLESGDSGCAIVGGLTNYPGGTSFFDGAPDPDGYDLWFREGYIVPEPASGLLVLLGIAGIWAARRLRGGAFVANLSGGFVLPAIGICVKSRPYERCRSQAKLPAAQTTKSMKLINLMKSYLFALQTALMLSALAARGQGTTFIYDQQSATNQGPAGGDGGAPIQEDQPMGQSFTPALSSVGFVQLKFDDFNPGNGLGATVYVNLLANSITGTVLDSTAPVFMPDGFSFGITNFFFATPVAVTPGTTYYLQPVVVSGDDPWDVVGGNYGYAGGTAFFNGQPSSTDLWFREGELVPEPASGLLVLLGVAGIWAARRLRGRGLLADLSGGFVLPAIGIRVKSRPYERCRSQAKLPAAQTI